MTGHPLPSSRFPLTAHLTVLRRFMAVSRNGAEPVAPAAVEGSEVPSGSAQENVAFLCDAGLLIEEAAGKFKPTPVAMQLINTLASDEARGRKLLRSLISKQWFVRSWMAAKAQDPSLGETGTLGVLAAESGASPTADSRSLAVLWEYLVYTGLVVRSPEAASQSPPPGPAVREPAANARAARPEVGAGGAGEWTTLRTEDFDLKIRPNRQAVRRLRKHLDLLEEDLR